jgi:hypothetical protein
MLRGKRSSNILPWLELKLVKDMKFHSVQAQSRGDILRLNVSSGFGSSLQLWPP